MWAWPSKVNLLCLELLHWHYEAMMRQGKTPCFLPHQDYSIGFFLILLGSFKCLSLLPGSQWSCFAPWNKMLHMLSLSVMLLVNHNNLYWSLIIICTDGRNCCRRWIQPQNGCHGRKPCHWNNFILPGQLDCQWPVRMSAGQVPHLAQPTF